MKISLYYEWVFSSALAAMAYAFALTGGNLSLLTLAQVAVILIAAFGLLIPGHERLRKKNIALLCVFSIVLLSTIFFNTNNYSGTDTSPALALAHTSGLIGLLFAVQWAATNLRARQLLRNIAVLLMPLIVLAIVVSLQSGGLSSRQSPFGIHPNWWGEIGFALTTCALALPDWRARAVPIATATALFIMVQSRGALLAAISSVGLYVLLSIRWSRLINPSRVILISTLATLGLVMLAIYQRYSIQAWLFIRDDVFLWNNSYRGVDSGLTGRLSGWQEAADIFLARPFFGSGIDTLTEVHNGFLRLAGEGGLILLLTIAALVGSGLRTAVKSRNYLAVSIIVGYLVYAMTYPRMLNMNLAAVVFYLSIFSWKKRSTTRRNHDSRPGALVHSAGFQPESSGVLDGERE